MKRPPWIPSQPLLALASLALLILAFDPAVRGADIDFGDGISVDTTEDAVDANLGDGQCADDLGRCTLRAAIQEANVTTGPQTLHLPAGLYRLTLAGSGEDLGLTGDLDISGDLTLLGAGAETTVIDANGAVTLDRAIHIKDTAGLGLAVTLQDLAVIHGSVLNVNGGGILVEASEGGGGPAPAVEASIVLALLGVRVADNVADSDQVDPVTGQAIGGSGGGVYSGGALQVHHTEISGNSAAANGGGLYAGGVVTLLGSLIADNMAEGGGGIFETGSHISTYTECALIGNTAVGGGGLSARTQTTVQFRNCTIDGNAATDVGGGIHTNGTVNLVYSTVTDNDSASDAPNGGAGLNSFGSGTFRLWSTLVAGNRVAVLSMPQVRNCGCTGGACTGMVQFLSLGFNLEDGDTCGLDRPEDHPGVAPGLLPLDRSVALAPVRPLRPISPAVDAGDPALCPVTDQRGTVRPIDGDGDGMPGCDIGAFEFDQGAIFSDGFEAGDTMGWSLTVGLP